ncbi:exodeoxyribonuclease V subunit gamma [Pseudonocardia hydrocarbonoxydans]|uniref:exodeoxyribonuclease V subunit gamma n=1 Tax=Pseudonocardia hydrocarbonoxydans TaxID=76726 RepID=UPI00114455FF|nr:exodeoxyribonuclease V subunit gamma [Pseudonocardia hydrocarbonoxydans]
MLHVHRAERADTLAGALAEVLRTPLPDPFATEVVAVPARGVERWLAQRLSHRLGTDTGGGVCAGVAFPSPGRVLADAVCAAAGVAPADDPWHPERVVWPLLDELDAAAGEPWCPDLRAHPRWATARRVAGLFATYAEHRPAMVDGWRDGADAPGDLSWQSELWRRVRARIGVPGPAERLRTAADALRADPSLAGLPARFSLFGPTRLSTEQLVLLDALAAHREVHLWLPHPSPALWEAVARRAPAEVPTRAADPTAGAVAHPLLSSLARDVRELQVRLVGAAPGFTDHHHPAPDPPPTQLGRLQRALRDDDVTDVGAADGSVQVHACHGAHRQVEVLREVVVGLLAADPTLEPRDVLVMCPDIETFAPLVSAAFGLGELGAAGHPGQHLRVRLADRALRRVNPLLDTVAALLELASARLTASQLLDLLASEPVRARFRLDDDDIVRIRELVVASGVRWGLDAGHRTPFHLGGFGQNTWAAGLDRLLLGVTMSGDWLGTALPLDVESGDVERVGRLAEFVHRLSGVLARLRAPQPLADWVDALTAGLDALTATTAVDEWQTGQARGELAEALRTAGPQGATTALGPADVAALLDERLRGRPSRAGFRTGTLTVATLVPMRSVPHRVVCLLGLDDGVFPRAGVPDGDDVLARAPLAGERDARSEDRQLLLDAVCAATGHLVVVHSGADERTGARRPPAVPLGELLDVLGPSVVVRHPLQPFDARNFTAGALGVARPFSFDRAEREGARAAVGVKAPPAAFLAAPLPARDEAVVALEDLVAFAEHPVRAFLRQRVGLSLFTRDDDPSDALPVELDGLAQYAIGARLLADRLGGRDVAHCRAAEWRRGDLPPGPLGESLLTRVLDGVELLTAAAQRLRVGEPSSRDVDVELADGTRVVGTLDGLHDRTLLRVEYSRLKAAQRLRAWVRLLALTAGTGEGWQAVSLGRSTRDGIARATLAPVPPEQARHELSRLVALRRDGLCEPLPLATQTGAEYARRRLGGADPDIALVDALRSWTGGIGECTDAAHERVWGAGADLPLGDGRSGGEPTRFGELAMGLWTPLLAHESVDFP